MTNREGLTFEEWVIAAGFLFRTVHGIKTRATRAKRLLDAWRAGEDPSEWRASPPKDFKRLNTCESIWI